MWAPLKEYLRSHRSAPNPHTSPLENKPHLVSKDKSFGGLIFLVQIPRVGYLMWNKNPSVLREAPDPWDPSWCGSLNWWGFWWDHLWAFLTCLDMALLSLVVEEAVQLHFYSLSAWIIPYVAIDLVCPWAVSSTSSYPAILDYLPWSFFHITSFIGTRFTWHAMWFTHFKCIIHWFLVYSQTYTAITTIHFITFLSPQKKSYSV